MLDNKNHWKNKMSQLKGYDSEIDFLSEWNALESRMDKRKRRKVIFWLWPLLLGLGLVSMYYYISDENSQGNIKHHQPENQTIATDKEKSITHENDLHLSKSDVNHDQHYTIQSKNEEKLINKTVETRSENLSYPDKSITNTQQQSLLNTYNNVEVEVSVENNEKIKKDKFAMGATSPGLVTGDAEGSNLSKDVRLHKRLESVMALPTIHGEVECQGRLIPYLTQVIVPQNKNQSFFMDVRLIAGRPVYDYVYVSMENESLLNTRKQHERPLEFIGGRWTLGKEIGHQWYVSLGMSYAGIHDRWKSKQLDTLDIILNDQIIETYINQDGIVTQKTGTKQSKQIVELTQTRYNASESLAGIISMGRYFYLHKIRWAIEGNLSLPVFTKFFGEVLDITGQMTALEKIYQPYKTLQYGIHTSCLYQVSGNLVVYGGYDYNFSRLSSDLGYFRKQNIHSLSIGLKYYINH